MELPAHFCYEISNVENLELHGTEIKQSEKVEWPFNPQKRALSLALRALQKISCAFCTEPNW